MKSADKSVRLSIIQTRFWQFVRWAIILLGIILFLFPLYYTITLSLKLEVDAFSYPPKWIFIPTFKNFRVLFQEESFLKYLANSLVISSLCVIVSMLFGIPFSYGLSRSHKKWSTPIIFAILALRVMPPMSILIPVFSLYVKIGWVDTYWGVVLMYLTFTMPLCVWMLKNAFDNLPNGIEEAARIDGCNTIQLLLWVSAPIVAEALAATAILVWVYSWNEFLYALILTRNSTKTAPVMINSFMNFESIRWGEISAAAVVISSPVLLFGILVRKYLVSGLSTGALKE